MLWGNQDNATGNNKPLYSNTATTFGVSETEAANTTGDGPKLAHSGWVKQTVGTGPVATITIVSGGSHYNTAGYLAIIGGGGANANVSYTVANSQNTLQSFSSNPLLNTISTLTIVSGGDGFTSAPLAFANTGGANATFTVTVGGRAGRRHYETLVATGSITGDDAVDDTFFPGT